MHVEKLTVGTVVATALIATAVVEASPDGRDRWARMSWTTWFSISQVFPRGFQTSGRT